MRAGTMRAGSLPRRLSRRIRSSSHRDHRGQHGTTAANFRAARQFGFGVQAVASRPRVSVRRHCSSKAPTAGISSMERMLPASS
jgi:hypothetical protein